MTRKKASKIILVSVAVIAVMLGGLYALIVVGRLERARRCTRTGG